ncbi:hypothetical protein ACP70R_026035 [Stipagrostis hirtigluma subsp. patula]
MAANHQKSWAASVHPVPPPPPRPARDRVSPGVDVARTVRSVGEPMRLQVVLEVDGGSHAVRYPKLLRGNERVISAEKSRFTSLTELIADNNEQELAADGDVIADDAATAAIFVDDTTTVIVH